MGQEVTRAVDTNIVIRYLTRDDPVQTPIATDILRAGFLLSSTVLIEVEWVLRSYYRWPRDRIAEALFGLIDLPSADVVPEGAKWALARFAEGADLTDMIHILAGVGASAFVTFDDDIASYAGANSPLPIETLP
jgi:predicted nucleic-acid-binding protein